MDRRTKEKEKKCRDWTTDHYALEISKLCTSTASTSTIFEGGIRHIQTHKVQTCQTPYLTPEEYIVDNNLHVQFRSAPTEYHPLSPYWSWAVRRQHINRYVAIDTQKNKKTSSMTMYSYCRAVYCSNTSIPTTYLYYTNACNFHRSFYLAKYRTFVCPTGCLFVRLSDCLYVCVFVRMSLCLFVCLSSSLFVCLSLYLFVCLRSACLSISLSICLSVSFKRVSCRYNSDVWWVLRFPHIRVNRESTAACPTPHILVRTKYFHIEKLESCQDMRKLRQIGTYMRKLWQIGTYMRKQLEKEVGCINDTAFLIFRY